jgi:hypothetical protein
MKSKIVVLAVISISLVLSLAFYLYRPSSSDLNEVNAVNAGVSNFAIGGEYDESSKKYDETYGTSGGYTPLILDVSTCQKGRDSASFAMGHTEFLVEGTKNGTCVFRYGTEIENPDWNGELTTKCAVPITEVPKLTVNNSAINFGPISSHCSKI